MSSYKIDKNFTGGNIEVLNIADDRASLTRELRDTSENWFYWAFRVTGAQGKTITFDVTGNYIGKFGPAVSYDLRRWKWLEKKDDNHTFTYTFADNEDCVYFAHNMLYNPDRFLSFCNNKGLEVKKFSDEKIPYIEFGEGSEYIVLTARHHACEATGNFVLEGVLDGFLKNPPKSKKILCVPFVDYSGVCAGDQGKSRIPHDHNRDYVANEKSLYASVRFIREFCKNAKIAYAFDFHSPWHEGKENDKVFIPITNSSLIDVCTKFSNILEEETARHSLKHFAKDDFLPGTTWNKPSGHSFAEFMCNSALARLAFTLETCYFGTEDNKFTDENAFSLGCDFARAVKIYADAEA